MDNRNILQAATAMHRQRHKGESITALTADLRPATTEHAYAVQDALIDLIEKEGHTVAGWKVALTSAVMQSLVGVNEPTAGAIFAARIHSSPAEIEANNYVNLGVESEVAVRIATDLSAASTPYDRDNVRAHIAECMAATELVDDRNWDYDKANAIDLIADNSFNAGCVLGTPVADWTNLNLVALNGDMEINGETVGKGVSADVLGHPFEPVAWLANHLLSRGRMLRAGEIVLTGSIVATRWLSPGDTMCTRVDDLGQAQLRVV